MKADLLYVSDAETGQNFNLRLTDILGSNQPDWNVEYTFNGNDTVKAMINYKPSLVYFASLALPKGYEGDMTEFHQTAKTFELDFTDTHHVEIASSLDTAVLACDSEIPVIFNTAEQPYATKLSDMGVHLIDHDNVRPEDAYRLLERVHPDLKA